MSFKQRSGNLSFAFHRPITPFSLEEIKNENILTLIDLLSRKNKSLDTIHKISNILEQTLEFSYFKLLKSKLSEIDYLTVIQKLGLSFREANSIIIEKRKRNDYLYVVLWGEIHVLDEIEPKEEERNEEQEEMQRQYEVINTLTKGDTFGQSSLINFKRQTSARVQAKTNSLLLTLSFDVFNRTILKITIMRKQEIANLLIKSSLFLSIDQDSIKDLVTEVYEVRFSLNQSIYHSESKHDSFYFIKNGIVELTQNGVKLVRLETGEYFGIENRELIEEARRQEAVSKSTDLVVYKIPFARLKVLQPNDAAQFMKNLVRDYNSKKETYDKLLTNHRRIERIIANNSLGNKSNSKKRRFKRQSIPLQPVWWGTANRNQSSPKPIEAEKQNFKRSGLLGSKRINLLRYTVMPKQSLREAKLNHSTSIVGSLPRSLFKKVVDKNIQSFDAELLKKRLIPQHKRQKLVKYAKSGIDSCETMFWI